MTSDEQEYLDNLIRDGAWHGMGLSPEEFIDSVRGRTSWISIEDSLPDHLQTVWISNGKGWTTLGCRVETNDGWHWAETNGTIYQEGEQIVSECESDDLDVRFWHPLPKAILSH
jgi:hypothetical protein